MRHYFSPANMAFYTDRSHGARRIEELLSPAAQAAGRKPRLIENPDCRMPGDVIELSAAEHSELMAAQGEGKVIVLDTRKRPVAIDPVITEEQVIAANRATRNRQLRDSDWTQMPDALLAEPEWKAAMAAWREAVRGVDLTRGDFPDMPERN